MASAVETPLRGLKTLKIGLATLVLGLSLYGYWNQNRKRNLSPVVARKIENNSVKNEKLTRLGSLISEPKTYPLPIKVNSPPSPSPTPTFIDLDQLSSAELARKIVSTFTEQKSKESLSLGIEAADELLKRDPNIYAAYKAKLLAQLNLDVLFDQEIDSGEFEFLLQEMYRFSNFDDSLALADDFPEQEGQENLSDANIDQDLIKLPFIKLLIDDELELLQEESQAYIEEFPKSPYGYYYLAQSLSRLGNSQDARNAIDRARSNSVSGMMDLELFEKSTQKSPKQMLDNIQINFDLEDLKE